MRLLELDFSENQISGVGISCSCIACYTVVNITSMGFLELFDSEGINIQEKTGISSFLEVEIHRQTFFWFTSLYRITEYFQVLW